MGYLLFSGKPTLDMSGVKDITVRAGQDIRINVPYKGVPQPTAKWSNGEIIIEESSRTTLKVRYDHRCDKWRLDFQPYGG